MSTAVEDRLSVEEFLARDWPRFTQLIDGVVVLNQPGVLHQRVAGLIFRALADWADRPTGVGEAFLSLNVVYETSVLAPDLLWFAQPPPLDGDADPDLLIEVRSPGSWRYDLERRREIYLDHGVPELWLVDTVGRRVLAHRSDGVWERHAEDDLISPQMPGFRALVSDLTPAI